MSKQIKKKWHVVDIVMLIIQIVFPLVALFIAWIIPTGTGSWQLSADIKLSLIGCGLLVPLIITQITIIVGQNKNEKSFLDVSKSIQQSDDKITHIHPILEKVFVSENERIMRFAFRRIDEVNNLIKYAVGNQRSGKLKPREYYEELDHLAKLIVDDKKLNDPNFNGEIWAMTSFAPDEWVNDDGYEGVWTDTLKKMVNMGIKTRRLCIVPARLFEIINTDEFTEPTKTDMPQYTGFIKLLIDYYGPSNMNDIARHYIIKDSTNTELTAIAGFFAIKLTNGELHILTGETIDKFGSLTAEVLFDKKEIIGFKTLCMKFMNDRNELETVIHDIAKQNGFLKHLDDIGVDITNFNVREE